MADKVEAVLERMTDELQYYVKEGLFSKKEVKKIVKERRNSEYKLQRKDATLLFFLDSIKFEKQLDRIRAKRMRKQDIVDTGKQKSHLADHAVKKRVMHLYDRATRKFKLNISLWKEYLEYLVHHRSFQKLNRVLSLCVQTHSTILDFWLIGVYTELDLKGNLFSGRKLMLQAIRNNSDNPAFYVEYFRFEVRFFEKVKQRIQILNGVKGQDKDIDFIDNEKDEEAKDGNYEGRLNATTKLIEIVFNSIKDQFGNNLEVIKACHDIAKGSEMLPTSVKDAVNQKYKSLKYSETGITQYFQNKITSIAEVSKLVSFFKEKLQTLANV